MTPGKTRTCPHCKATILESVAVCPGCQHHLKFDPALVQRMVPAATPLRVEGSLRHPPEGDAWEYSIVLSVRNELGEEVTRQVVGVGSLAPTEVRTFSVAVELFVPRAVREPLPETAAAAEPPRISPFPDPRVRPPAPGRGVHGTPKGPPPLPRDPRPPAQETHARLRGTLPDDPT